MVSLGVIVPANFFQELSLWISILVGSSGVVSLSLYALSRRGKDYPWVVFTVHLLTLNVVWFFNGGSTGCVGSFLAVAFMLAVVLFRSWARAIVLMGLVVDTVGLLVVEHAAPQLIIPFAHPHDRLIDLSTGLVISGLTCSAVFWVVLKAYHRQEERQRKANEELKHKLAEIRTLQGMLPICAWCRRVRTDEGLWTRVEQYLTEHTDAKITHGLCPDCEREMFGEEAADEEERFSKAE